MYQKTNITVRLISLHQKRRNLDELITILIFHICIVGYFSLYNRNLSVHFSISLSISVCPSMCMYAHICIYIYYTHTYIWNKIDDDKRLRITNRTLWICEASGHAFHLATKESPERRWKKCFQKRRRKKKAEKREASFFETRPVTKDKKITIKYEEILSSVWILTRRRNSRWYGWWKRKNNI